MEILGTISRTGWEGGSGKMARVVGRAELGTISTAVWDGGLLTVGGTGVKDEFGSLSRAGCEGRSVKMIRVGGRIGLSIITRYHLVGVFGTVRRTRATEGMGTIPGP
jgi:hypothetical protein